MINYYEKLNIEKDSSTEEIADVLKKLERAWMQRIMQQPEKAQEMLFLISETKEVFRSEESRKEYDDSLHGGGDVAPVDSRRQNYEKWYASAKKFYESKQYDLAKTSVEKAMGYIDFENEDPKFCDLVARIYCTLPAYGNSALEWINKAIVLKPDKSLYYVNKAVIYESCDICNVNRTEEMRKNYQRGLEKAKHEKNTFNCGLCCGNLARSYYYDYPTDKEKAMSYAEEAVNIGKGDREEWGRRVIEEEAEHKRREAKAEAERKRKEAEAEAERKRKEAEAEAERKRKEAEAERRHKEAEAEAKRKVAEEAKRKAEEAKRKAEEEANRKAEAEMIAVSHRAEKISKAAFVLGIVILSLSVVGGYISIVTLHRGASYPYGIFALEIVGLIVWGWGQRYITDLLLRSVVFSFIADAVILFLFLVQVLVYGDIYCNAPSAIVGIILLVIASAGSRIVATIYYNKKWLY